MLKNIFEKLSQKISYTFAVAFFSVISSIVPAYYALFFSYITIDIKSDINITLLLAVLTTHLAIALFFYAMHLGLFHKIGLSGFSNSIKTINKYMDNGNVLLNHSKIETDEIEKLYKYIVNLPGENFIVVTIYALLMLVNSSISYYILTGKVFNIPILFAGGVFSSVIYGYFTFNISEYFTGNSKSKIEDILFQRKEGFSNRYLLSFKYKSIFTLILISFNMIVLSLIIRQNNKPIVQLAVFILISIITIGLLIFLLFNTIRISLAEINLATRDLATGGRGLCFPAFSDRELALFSKNYNTAALEIYRIRADLAKNVAERTEAIVIAYGKLNGAYNRIQDEMILAKKIQSSILPLNLEELEGVKLDVKYFPMSEIGGDIYDVFELFPGYYRIFLADATGHGVQAAMVTMIIKGEYEKIKKYNTVPSGLLAKLNNSFLELYEFLNVFFTCNILDLDMNKKKIIYSSAGHPDQVFIGTEVINFLQSTGRIIGVLPDTIYQDIEIDIKQDDKLILYTDGIFEQFDEEEEVFGEDRLKKIITENYVDDVDVIIKKIIIDLREFLGGTKKVSKDDDITVIGIQFE